MNKANGGSWFNLLMAPKFSCIYFCIVCKHFPMLNSYNKNVLQNFPKTAIFLLAFMQIHAFVTVIKNSNNEVPTTVPEVVTNCHLSSSLLIAYNSIK